MSSKSNQNSINTILGSLTINNASGSNANNYEEESTVITPKQIIVNGNPISLASIISYSFQINLTVPANDTAEFIFNGNVNRYVILDSTVPTWSFTCDNPIIFISNYSQFIDK
jgi:hypothetical protein